MGSGPFRYDTPGATGEGRWMLLAGNEGQEVVKVERWEKGPLPSSHPVL